MSARLAATLVALAFSGAVAMGAEEARSDARATPISKVLEMMEEMAAKGLAEKKAEEVRFTAFWQWCGDQTRIKNDEIKKATDKIAMLKAAIEKQEVHIQQLTDRIQELEDDIARWVIDRKSASDVRAKEAADYQATSVDFTETLTAIDGALTVMKKQAVNTAQAALVQQSLLQVQRSRIMSPAAKKTLMAFLQQPSVEEMPDERLLRGSPEAYGYEFQSGGVVEMLEKLKDQFSEQKYELDKDEQNAQHAFGQIMQQLTDNEENAQHEIDKKTKLRAQVQAEKADNEAEKAQTEKDLAEDQKYLEEMMALCAVKKADFESRAQLRADELAAISQAIEIISSQTVKGAGEKYLPADVALSQAPALSQLRIATRQDDLQARLASFLEARAKTYGSKMLAALALRVTADPFTKVKKMIKDLIWKLMEEATAETEHKGWCDTELGTNKLTRERTTETLNQLTAQEEDLTAEIAELTQNIEDLTKAIAELEEQRAKATEDRAASKAKNEETVADAKAAQVAVQNAIAVLKDFYAKSAQATALAQQTPAEDAPETFDKPYKGMLPEGGNVVDFLDVILTDFARLESDTISAEASELEEYKKFMHESELDMSLKDNEKGHKTEKKTDQEGVLQQVQVDMKNTQEELEAAITYYEKLKPTCVDSGVTYEDRVKRREAEMQSLKEALNILQGTDIDLAN